MASVASTNDVMDPIPLAIAVIADRIRDLSSDDRNDLFELTQALRAAQTDEEYESAVRGMREILEHRPSGLRAVESPEPGPELRKWMDFVGGRIRQFRERAGLTQEQLAAKAGLPQSHISRLENGRHSPSAVTIERIAAALDIEPTDLAPSA